MLLGIDVGGTTTNAVLTDGTAVVAEAAVPTLTHDLAGSVLAALDGVMRDARPSEVERIALSTTVITNLLAEDKAERVELVLLPGPGADPADYELPPAHLIEGAIDYRGREIIPLAEDSVRSVGAELRALDCSKVAVVGKFCQRNSTHESRVRDIFQEECPDMVVECGHLVSGRLNFPRRAATTLLTMATRDRYKDFAADMSRALEERGLSAPVFVLKADGGTLPLDYSVRTPMETIFSGPAASTMGALALGPPGESFIVMDVGGTTTDLALVLDGRPLLSSKGARVQQLLTHVRAFAVKSVPVGGDSAVRVAQGALTVGPDRMGAPVCLGGPLPTPTDALRVLGLIGLGDGAAAHQVLSGLGDALGLDANAAAQHVVDTVAATLAREVTDMFARWRDEPVYRVWEVVREQHARPELLVGVGGGAPALAPAVASRLGVGCLVTEHAPVANAFGAAVSRPTMSLTLSVDTDQGNWVTEEDGRAGRLTDLRLSLADAEDMALRLLAAKVKEAGIGSYAREAEVTHSEVFNMVRGWHTIGRLMNVAVEIPAGLLNDRSRS
ncbi:MAG: hydantoinase/oxoprolinase family protein [Thermoleophilia bacterium]|jgi:N-methylhydantoinase A